MSVVSHSTVLLCTAYIGIATGISLFYCTHKEIPISRSIYVGEDRYKK